MENVVERLREKKAEMSVTNAWIAEKSGVPESTVTKVFNGTNKSPTIATLGPIAASLGVSIDAGVIVSDEHQNIKPCVPNDIYLQMLIASYDRQLESMEARIRRKNKWIFSFAVGFAVVFAAVLFVLIYDITHPDMGWFQYQQMMAGKISGWVDVIKDMFVL